MKYVLCSSFALWVIAKQAVMLLKRQEAHMSVEVYYFSWA